MMTFIVFLQTEQRKQMAGEKRQRMVVGAMQLLGKRGLHATSFSEVLAATGGARGSLYHHFPDGKDQLIAAAVDFAGKVLTDAMEGVAGEPAQSVVERFLAIWRSVLSRSDCEAGCAVLAVTVATDSAELLQHATGVFRAWRKRLSELLCQGGLRADTARQFATMLIASAEGAVVLSRAEKSSEPFEAVASQLLEQVRALQPADSGR